MTISLRNSTSYNSFLPSSSLAPMQDLLHVPATILGPPIAAALCNHTWSYLSTFSFSDTQNKIKEIGSCIAEKVSSFFSYLTSEQSTKTLNCATGLIALSSGQPILQLAGSSLLTNCINLAGVSANETFFTTASFPGNFTPWGVNCTKDGGYIVTGHVVSHLASGDHDIFITKFAKDGTQNWTTILNGTAGNAGNSALEAQNGDYIVSGYTHKSGLAWASLSIFSPNGTAKDSITLGNETYYLGSYSLHQLSNSDLVMGGFSTFSGSFSVALIKTTSNRTPIWAKTFAQTGNSFGRALLITQNNSFAIAGYTSMGAGNWDLLLETFDDNGDILWARTLGGINQDLGVALTETQAGNIAVAGYTDNSGSGKTNGLISIFKPNGHYDFAVSFGGTNEAAAFGIEETQNKKLVVIGYVKGFDAGTGLIAAFNEDRSLLWAQVLKGNSTCTCLHKTPDGGVAISGTLVHPVTQESELFLLKIDANARLPNCDALEFIDLPVNNITHLLNFSSFSPNLTSITPSVTSWFPAAITPQMIQNHICPHNTSTASRSLAESFPSLTSSLSRSILPSHSNSLQSSLSQSITSKHTLSPEKTKSLSTKRTHTKSPSFEQTRTYERTKTVPMQFQRMTLLELSKLLLPGVVRMQLAQSGTLLQTKTNTGYRLVTIDSAGKMRTAGEFATLGITQATAFSRDEKYDFIANDQGKIQVFDIQNPENPNSLGFLNLEIPINSLGVSEIGEHLLVGTNTGILAFSAKTPNDIVTMKALTNYTTSDPVVAIRPIPNTNRIVIGTGNEVKILDFVDEKFTLIASQKLPSPIKSIAPSSQVDPTQIVISLENQDTVIMNAANSSSFVTLGGTPNEIRAISGTTLLASGVKQGIQILQNENQNWHDTREVGYNPVTDRVTDILYSSDGRFCVYSDSEGIKLMKRIEGSGFLENPLPRLVRNVKPGFPVLEIFPNEEKNWIALGGNQLSFMAGDNLEIPTILGTLNTIGNVRKIVAFPDKTKLLFADSGGIGYVNCFNPKSPSILSRWNSSILVNDITLERSYAYISQQDRITVLDISNPSNMTVSMVIPTKASAECNLFDADGMFSFLGTSDGIDIHSAQSSQLNYLTRLNATGFISHMRLHNNTLYYASEQYLGKVDISDPSNPQLLSRLDFTYPIKGLILVNGGKSALLTVEISGTFVVDTQSMQAKGNLPSTTSSSISINELGDKIYVACNQNGFQVAELITELPIIPLTSKNQYPVDILTEETFKFYNQGLEPIEIDRINSIHLLDKGQKKELPLWISADLLQKKLFIRAPKEFTDQSLNLLISLDVGGVRQETIYQAKVVSSLEISLEKGSLSLSTPSTLGSVAVELNGAKFMPHLPGLLSVSSKDNILQAQGPISVINEYLRQIRINPDPIELSPSAVALNVATVVGKDIINLYPTNGTVRLRSFIFNQPPVVNRPMNLINKKALQSFEINIPPETFTDPDDQKLLLTAGLANGTKLPSWLKFDPITATFSGIAPTSMLNQTLQILLNASDGYLSVHNTWELQIDSNRAPFVAKPLPPETRETGSEFSFAVPKGTFQDLDNNTLTFNALENGYNNLPAFLSFDPTTLTFRGTPSVDDIRTYSIKLTATDQFGALASIDFDLDIKFSQGDFIDYILNKAAIVSAVLTPFTAAYLYRVFLHNLIHRKSYWRNKSPLIDNQIYKLKKPFTEKEIDLDEIARVHIQEIDKKKMGHDFAQNKLPLHSYISLYSHALINNEPLPSWLQFNSEKGEVILKKQSIPPNKTYVFQVVSRNGHILESFFIEGERSEVNLSEIISLSGAKDTLAEFEMALLNDPQENNTQKPVVQLVPQPKPDVWADLDLEAIADYRPGEKSQTNRQLIPLAIAARDESPVPLSVEPSLNDEGEIELENETYMTMTGANSLNPKRDVLETALKKRSL